MALAWIPHPPSHAKSLGIPSSGVKLAVPTTLALLAQQLWHPIWSASGSLPRLVAGCTNFMRGVFNPLYVRGFPVGGGVTRHGHELSVASQDPSLDG